AAQQGGLAGAVAADHGDDAAGHEVEVDVGEHERIAVAGGQPARAPGRGRGGHEAASAIVTVAALPARRGSRSRRKRSTATAKTAAPIAASMSIGSATSASVAPRSMIPRDSA